MLQKISFQNEEGQTFSAHLNIPAEEGKYPAVIILHDFRENKDREFLFDIAGFLNAWNICALRFDFLGHGESEGNFEFTTVSDMIDDVKAAIDFLETIPQVDSEKIALVGHGLGGMVSVIYAPADERVKALVLAGVRSHIEGFLKSHYSENEILEWKTIGFHHAFDHKIRKNFLEDLENHDVLESMKKVKCPVFIITGTNDKRTPFENARELYLSCNAMKNLDIVEGADHNFTGDYRQYFLETAAAWLSARLKS